MRHQDVREERVIYVTDAALLSLQQVLRRLQESLDRKVEEISNAESEVESEVEETPSLLALNNIAFGALSTGTVEELFTGGHEHSASKSITPINSPQTEEGEIVVLLE